MLELQCIYDTKKSFYNKAMIKEVGEKKYLYSYDTLVAKIENNTAIVYGAYSQTTLRHIKEFLLQNNFKAINKAQILKDYFKD